MSKRVTSAFELEGRFLGFAAKKGDYKLKYLRLATSTGEHTIKVSKDLRRSLQSVMVPGEWLKVVGWQKQDFESGTVKLVADGVSRATPASQVMPISDPTLPYASPACILFCQKSDCCKRGGRQVAQALQEGLDDRALNGQVILKGTGCMKRCKAGPNIVMPDKTRYTQIRPEEVPAILDKHFPQPVQSASAAMNLETIAAF